MLRVLLLASALALGWLFLSVFLGSSQARAADVGSTLDAAEVVPAPVADSVLPEPVPVAPVDPLPSVAEQGVEIVRPAETERPAEDVVPAVVEAVATPVVETVATPVVETVAELAPSVAPQLPNPAPAVDAVVDLVLPALDGVASSLPAEEAGIGLASAAADAAAPESLALEITPAALPTTGEGAGELSAASTAPSVPGPASEHNEPATAPAGGGETHSGPWAVVDASHTGSADVRAAGVVVSVNPPSFAGKDPPSTPD